jgi:hypothetical protein
MRHSSATRTSHRPVVRRKGRPVLDELVPSEILHGEAIGNGRLTAARLAILHFRSDRVTEDFRVGISKAVRTPRLIRIKSSAQITGYFHNISSLLDGDSKSCPRRCHN